MKSKSLSAKTLVVLISFLIALGTVQIISFAENDIMIEQKNNISLYRKVKGFGVSSNNEVTSIQGYDQIDSNTILDYNLIVGELKIPNSAYPTKKGVGVDLKDSYFVNKIVFVTSDTQQVNYNVYANMDNDATLNSDKINNAVDWYKVNPLSVKSRIQNGLMYYEYTYPNQIIRTFKVETEDKVDLNFKAVYAYGESSDNGNIGLLKPTTLAGIKGEQPTVLAASGFDVNTGKTTNIVNNLSISDYSYWGNGNPDFAWDYQKGSRVVIVDLMGEAYINKLLLVMPTATTSTNFNVYGLKNVPGVNVNDPVTAINDSGWTPIGENLELTSQLKTNLYYGLLELPSYTQEAYRYIKVVPNATVLSNDVNFRGISIYGKYNASVDGTADLSRMAIKTDVIHTNYNAKNDKSFYDTGEDAFLVETGSQYMCFPTYINNDDFSIIAEYPIKYKFNSIRLFWGLYTGKTEYIGVEGSNDKLNWTKLTGDLGAKIGTQSQNGFAFDDKKYNISKSDYPQYGSDNFDSSTPIYFSNNNAYRYLKITLHKENRVGDSHAGVCYISTYASGGDELTPTQILDNDVAQLTAESIKGGNDFFPKLTADLNLYTEGKEKSSITWVTDDDSAVKTTGKVIRGPIDKNVKLTATLTAGNQSRKKSFNATVQALPSGFTDGSEIMNILRLKKAEDISKTPYVTDTHMTDFINLDNEWMTTGYDNVVNTKLVFDLAGQALMNGKYELTFKTGQHRGLPRNGFSVMASNDKENWDELFTALKTNTSSKMNEDPNAYGEFNINKGVMNFKFKHYDANNDSVIDTNENVSFTYSIDTGANKSYKYLMLESNGGNISQNICDFKAYGVVEQPSSKLPTVADEYYSSHDVLYMADATTSVDRYKESNTPPHNEHFYNDVANVTNIPRIQTPAGCEGSSEFQWKPWKFAWTSKKADVTLKLKSETKIQKSLVYFGSYSPLPDSVKIEISEDGNVYNEIYNSPATNFGSTTIPYTANHNEQKARFLEIDTGNNTQYAKYVKYTFYRTEGNLYETGELYTISAFGEGVISKSNATPTYLTMGDISFTNTGSLVVNVPITKTGSDSVKIDVVCVLYNIRDNVKSISQIISKDEREIAEGNNNLQFDFGSSSFIQGKNLIKTFYFDDFNNLKSTESFKVLNP